MKIDGNSIERVNGYATWRVIDNDGNLICAFYGPMAASAAATFYRACENNTQLSPLEITYIDREGGLLRPDDNDDEDSDNGC